MTPPRLRLHSRAGYRLALLVLAALVFVGPLRVLAAESHYAPTLPAVRANVEQKTDGVTSTYDLNLSLDQATNPISGTERVDFINTTGEPQETIYFRLYPNADYYDEGGL